LIEEYYGFWMQLKSGSQGFSGKKAVNAMTMFNQLFEETGPVTEVEVDEVIEDSDDAINEVLGE